MLQNFCTGTYLINQRYCGTCLSPTIIWAQLSVDVFENFCTSGQEEHWMFGWILYLPYIISVLIGNWEHLCQVLNETAGENHTLTRICTFWIQESCYGLISGIPDFQSKKNIRWMLGILLVLTDFVVPHNFSHLKNRRGHRRGTENRRYPDGTPCPLCVLCVLCGWKQIHTTKSVRIRNIQIMKRKRNWPLHFPVGSLKECWNEILAPVLQFHFSTSYEKSQPFLGQNEGYKALNILLFLINLKQTE